VPAPEWDYSLQAEWYRFRPSYGPAAIARLVAQVGARRSGHVTADVGAGTGMLSSMLLAAGVRPIVAIEPTATMRARGIAATRGAAVAWLAATGEATALAEASVDWFTMGSSFNTTDRARCLAEAARVLRPGGWFTCLWNHRDVEHDPVQRRVEQLIRRRVPAYAPGTRREDQAPVIAASGWFDPAEVVAVEHHVERGVDDYLAAWRSVRNRYWDLGTPAGRALFASLCDDIRAELGADARLRIPYTTRAWSARVRK
jgi:SAM-dependent methyltransferase